jgi:hypothetical protein
MVFRAAPFLVTFCVARFAWASALEDFFVISLLIGGQFVANTITKFSLFRLPELFHLVLTLAKMLLDLVALAFGQTQLPLHSTKKITPWSRIPWSLSVIPMWRRGRK